MQQPQLGKPRPPPACSGFTCAIRCVCTDLGRYLDVGVGDPTWSTRPPGIYLPKLNLQPARQMSTSLALQSTWKVSTHPSFVPFLPATRMIRWSSHHGRDSPVAPAQTLIESIDRGKPFLVGLAFWPPRLFIWRFHSTRALPSSRLSVYSRPRIGSGFGTVSDIIIQTKRSLRLNSV